ERRRGAVPDAATVVEDGLVVAEGAGGERRPAVAEDAAAVVGRGAVEGARGGDGGHGVGVGAAADGGLGGGERAEGDGDGGRGAVQDAAAVVHEGLVVAEGAGGDGQSSGAEVVDAAAVAGRVAAERAMIGHRRRALGPDAATILVGGVVTEGAVGDGQRRRA